MVINGKIIGKVFSLNYSKSKGIPRVYIEEANLVEGLGLEGDSHSDGGLKQISLLGIEQILTQKKCTKVKNKTKSEVLKPGDFGENITTQGIEYAILKRGLKLKIGKEAIIRITKKGRNCHKYCAMENCILPSEAIFAEVIKSGIIKKYDPIEVIND